MARAPMWLAWVHNCLAYRSAEPVAMCASEVPICGSFRESRYSRVWYGSGVALAGTWCLPLGNDLRHVAGAPPWPDERCRSIRRARRWAAR